jgi:hypothetical protein
VGSIETAARLVANKETDDDKTTTSKKKNKRKGVAVDVDDISECNPYVSIRCCNAFTHCSPCFHHVLRDSSVKLGKRKTFTVTNTTLPEPEVVWMKNDAVIDLSDEKYELRHDKGECLCVHSSCHYILIMFCLFRSI